MKNTYGCNDIITIIIIVLIFNYDSSGKFTLQPTMPLASLEAMLKWLSSW
jgi:hypothetical protein